ncbi:MAG: hypothetical protein Q9174_006261, partial [Haloplaca sp. 1 TL-2023]
MATSSQRPERAYHQDYICRIRYENDLPPPPVSLKMLDIPIDGLDYYASPGFASRLHRSQPINIEADSELGMPINLVGMPGVFDGDESSIQAPSFIPPIHPKDKNLLRPLSELGKPKYQGGGISFLRRTEYISSATARARTEDGSKSNAKSPAPRPRKAVDAAKDEPINVLRAAIRGFDIPHSEDAYTGPDSKENLRGLDPSAADLEAWNNPKHPAKSSLRALESYPILPDLQAIPDIGNYMIAKFTANPTQLVDKYDPRLDVGMLKPNDPTEATKEEYQAKLAAHAANPASNPHPGGMAINWNFYLAPDEETAKNLKRKLDVDDPDRDDPGLYTSQSNDGRDVFRVNHQRVYETGRSTAMDPDHAYKEVAFALHDGEVSANSSRSTIPSNGSLPHGSKKAAYYYPIAQKMQLKPHRSKNLAKLGVTTRIEDEDDEMKIDAFEVV